LRERGWADPLRTRGQTLRYSRYNIIILRLIPKVETKEFISGRDRTKSATTSKILTYHIVRFLKATRLDRAHNCVKTHKGILGDQNPYTYT
jgi:hypothetical protein